MPLISDQGAPAARFNITVYSSDDDRTGRETHYSIFEEAKAAFEKLEAGEQFPYGGLYRWNDAKANWDCLDAWPEDWDGE